MCTSNTYARMHICVHTCTYVYASVPHCIGIRDRMMDAYVGSYYTTSQPKSNIRSAEKHRHQTSLISSQVALPSYNKVSGNNKPTKILIATRHSCRSGFREDVHAHVLHPKYAALRHHTLYRSIRVDRIRKGAELRRGTSAQPPTTAWPRSTAYQQHTHLTSINR